jgi:hypothetical protein
MPILVLGLVAGGALVVLALAGLWWIAFSSELRAPTPRLLQGGFFDELPEQPRGQASRPPAAGEASADVTRAAAA